MAANMYFNWAYRRMVNRLPRGALTPLAKIFDRLQEEIVPSGVGRGDATPEGTRGLQIQLGRDYLRHANTLEVHLEGVLEECTAYPLQERINTLIGTTSNDVLVHCGHLTTIMPQAVQILLEGTRQAFEQRRVQLILQEVDASLSGWLRQVPMPSYATVITVNSEVTATGD
jgi:anti-anti-sigma regulatory factor